MRRFQDLQRLDCFFLESLLKLRSRAFVESLESFAGLASLKKIRKHGLESLDGFHGVNFARLVVGPWPLARTDRWIERPCEGSKEKATDRSPCHQVSAAMPLSGLPTAYPPITHAAVVLPLAIPSCSGLPTARHCIMQRSPYRSPFHKAAVSLPLSFPSCSGRPTAQRPPYRSGRPTAHPKPYDFKKS